MEAIYTYLNSLVNKNKSEFANRSDINWLNPYKATEYQDQRDRLITYLDNSPLFNGTKPFYNHISKGCSICGSGKWSCLFITNKCNAGCFYCPTLQTKDEVPATQGIEFDDPIAYAEYIKKFEFEGVSFSGGEPFLFFERTLNYLKAVRKICSNDVYTWVYTNGILVDKEKLKKLADAGLNEIRFDIGATNFDLDRVKLAKGIIPVITIEIPAVPEEKEKIIAMLPEMVTVGVNNLNLHQLRMTQHNSDKLIKRGYTIINAERPIVLESELAALEICNAAQEKSIDIGINYCSFYFKYRFQKAGFRSVIARKLQPNAFITSNGYIREFTDNNLSYSTIKLSDEPTVTSNNNSIELRGKKYFYSIITLYNETIPAYFFNEVIKLLESEPDRIPDDPFLFKIWQIEYIEKGLRELV